MTLQFDCGPLRFRTMDLSKDQVVPSHRHNFAHPTMVQAGGVRLEMPEGTFEVWAKDGADQIVKLVPAGIEHKIVALVDGTRVFCIYPHRDEDGCVVAEPVGFEKAYW